MRAPLPTRLGLVLAPLLAIALGTAATAAASSLPTGFQDEVAFEGLNEPTTFKIAADGRTFVGLKNGEIKVFPKNSAPNATPKTFADLRKEVYDNGDHGLLGLALDPKFDEGRPYVYALYSFDHELGKPLSEVPRWGQPPEYEGEKCAEENKCVVSGRLVRITAEADHAVPSAAEPEEQTLVEGWCQQSSTHSIGDLRFGPEGALFVSGGEGAAFTVPDYGQFENLCGDPPGAVGEDLTPPSAEGGSLRSQSLLRPDGKVLLNGTLLRINPNTGEGWPGNPLAGSLNANARRIIGFGFRNPFRFAIDPRSREVFVNNVGNGDDEEIDRVPFESAQPYNSGWPCYEGLHRNYQFEILELSACQRLYQQPGSTQQPFFHYSHSSVVAPGDPCPTYFGSAISASAFYEGSAYPSSYDNALFFADAVRGCIYVMYADEDGEPDPLNVVPFLSESSVYPGVDLEQGPEGEILYDSLYAGTINRIFYDPGAPKAQLTANKEWGETPLTVEFDASKSTGPEGDHLTYEWDLDGNGEFNDGSGVTETKTYVAKTNVNVAVRVDDEATGKSSVARLTIYPGDSPPAVEIHEPLQSLTWGVAQPIHFSGSATAEGGSGPAIEAKGLYWKTRLLHCPFGPTMCHEHPLQVFPGVKSGELPAPDHDYPSYLSFFLIATDNRGLSAEATVKIAARPVTLKLRSSPAGISIVAGTKTVTTPFDLQVVEGSPTTIVAPSSAVVGGVSYTFKEWSDGGARVHTVPAKTAGEYTAIYTGPPPPPPKPRRPKIHKRPAKKTDSRRARFAFGGEAGLRFRCKIDGKAYSSCHSPRVYKHLKPGRKHSFRVQGLNSARSPVTKVTKFTWWIRPPRQGRASHRR